jgi:gliding motility-associated-like protein
MIKGDTHVKVDAGVASFYAERVQWLSYGIISPKRFIKFLLALLAMWIFISFSGNVVKAQSGLCDPTVPFFTVNLTGQPNGTWISPNVVRLDHCCGTSNPDRCLEFSITLDPGTVALNFYIASGAIPAGSMFYQINCGPPVVVGTPICLTGPGPYTLTFCKPGNNPNTYAIVAIPAPAIVGDTMASIICPAHLSAPGFDPSSLTWSDITSGTGAYNAYLSSTTSPNVTVTPQPGFPPYVDYQVCGDVLAPECFASIYVCDTVRVYFYNYVTASITPNPASYCQNQGGVLLTGNHFNGIGPYTYEWHNGPNGTGPIVGTGATYFATHGGTFSLIIRDATYPHCPQAVTNVVVNVYPNPALMLAPAAPIACYGVPVPLTASGANNYTWSPAIGLSATTGSTVIAMPPVTTTYTIIGTNNPSGCADTLYFTFTVLPPPSINAGPDDTICFGGSTQLHGSGGFVYQWTPSTGLSNPNIANPIASPTVTTTYVLSAWAISGQLIYNGDFSLGNVGFSTDYIYQFNLWPEGYYYVGNNPHDNHPNWTACADHTPSADNMMMIVNGAPVANQHVWCQTINVTPNTTYAFSTWLCSVHPANPARLQFSINGILIGAPFNASGTVCLWNQFFAIWNSGANTTAQICIVNENLIRNGNDFALDDISFSPLCENTDSVTIYVSHPVLNISGTNISCFNGNNGSASVTASGGFAPYHYIWSNGQTASNISGLIAGTYTVTVTDAAACTATASIIITQPTQVTVTITATTNVSCNGGSNGAATVTAAGGTSPYSYLWSNFQTTSAITNLTASTYTVTVTDSHGCTATATVTITQPNPLVASIATSTNVSCFGGNNGSATASGSGGTIPYSYLWSNGGNTATINNLTAGTYIVTITDSHVCTATASVIITQPTLLSAAISSATNVNCFGGNNGSANVVAAGGTSPYTYLWSNGQTNSLATGLTAGNYCVTVTDAHSCTATACITITQPTLLTATISSSTNVSCFGGSNGTATVTGAGGTPAYSYLWSTTAITATVTGLSSGTYTVTITDSHGCTASASIIITQPTLLTTAISSSTNVSCFGGNNGSATVTPTGGTAPYSYIWSNSAITQTITNLIAGTYIVTVTDNLGCTSSSSVIITEPSRLIASISASTNISCNGGNNGSATVTASGGTPAYSYLWSNAATTATINNLTDGTYTVTVTDSHGCTATASVTLTQPTILNAAIGMSTNVSCFGGNDGTSFVIAAGGTPPYTYLWSNGVSTAGNSNLTAGTYTVTITDSHGCTATASVIITQPTLLTSSITSTTNVSCFGGNNGSATVTANGGTIPYTYIWSSGGTLSTETGLIAGTYTVTVTDHLGCTTTSTITITQPTLLTSSISSSTNVSCFGGNNGSATVTPVGGTIPYSYLWSNSAITATINNLVAGTYTVTVTDNQGCTTTSSVVITQPTLLTAVVSLSTNVSCFGGSNGTATVTAGGGTVPYSYLWSSGGTGTIESNLPAGTYTVTVTDALSCTATASVIITQPTLLTATISGSINVSCFSGNNGSATVVAAGGTSPYSYLWSSGGTNPTENGLTAGVYTVTITDSHGCTATASVTITQPALLTTAISSSTNVSCFGGSNGSATVTPTGGTAPYSYLWSNSAITQTINNLVAGTYTVTVTDNHGCTSSVSVTITEPTLLTSSITSSNNVSCNGGNNGSATVTAVGGTPAYTYLWSNAAITATINNLTAGTYTVTVTDNHGCTSTSSVIITQPTQLNAAIGMSTNVSCFGGNDGTSFVIAAGGTPPYTYLWSNGAITAGNSNLTAGTYTVTITDSHGCTATASVIITQPTLLTSSITSTTNVSCFGGNNGSATVTANGGTLPYTYIWSSGGTLATETGLVAGNYTVTVTDHLGCTTTSTITITQPALLTSSISSSTNVSCFGGNNGSATVTPVGGTIPYSYLWSNSAITATINNLIAGTYSVTVTDNLGCTTTSSVVITQPTLLTSSITSSTNVSCFGGSNGSATVAGAGGTLPYSYLWSSGGTGAIENNLSAGTYTVTVTDAHGCTSTNSIIITQPTLLTVSIASSVNVSCFMGSDGSAAASAAGGTSPYSYLWSSGGTNATETGLIAGTYTVTTTDALGCTATVSIIITQPTLLTASITSISHVSCFAFANGSATVTAGGGTPPYIYLWSSGGTNPTESGLIAGTYTVTITDHLACTATATVTITQPTLLTSTIASSTNVSCFGGNNGSATVLATGGTAPYSYLWSTGGTNPLETGLSAGTYGVTISDNHGCTSSASIVITEPALLTANISSIINITCFNGNDGSATVVGAGGTLPYSYLWSSGGTNSTESGLIAGNYIVTITDAHGCTATASITLTQPTLLTATITSFTNVSCFGFSDGSATVTAAGSVPAYTYLWSNGAITPTIPNIAVGTYTVTVTDSHGCTATASVSITGPTLLIFNVSSLINVNCFGENNGSIDMFITGGTVPYTYVWSNGATTEDIFNLYAGNYNVMVTDLNGCQAYIDTVITQPPLLTSSITSATNVSCFGGNNGSATVTANGGTLPYSYIWSNGANTPVINNLIAGAYVVTITDNHGCTTTSSITITQPTLLTSVVSSSTNVSCFGGNDGSAVVTVGGGVTPYSYLWSNGSIDYFINNITIGTYSVTITDANGCTITSSITITEPTLLTASMSGFSNISCFGGNDGSATVVANGGTSPYTFQWSSGGSSDIENNLPAGNYEVTVTDDHGCTASATITLSEPTQLTSSIATSGNVSCFGGNNGSAQAAASGGTIPYTFLWSNGGTSSIINSLTAGNYIVTITDNNGCTTSTGVTITQPTLLTASITSTINVSCFGGSNGSATVTAHGGIIPYSYNWSSGGSNATETNLTAGAYTVTVTDNNGCTVTSSLTITQPTLLTSSISSSTNVSCFSGSNGAASSAANGGVSPYHYLWNNGSITATINNLVAGVYNVTITDANGCTSTSSVTITQPTLLTAVINASNNVSCFGGNNGSASVLGSGGTLPYNYNWSSGQNTASINNLTSGNYSVTITDAHNCTATASITITQPTLLTSNIATSTNVSCFGLSDGTATVNTAGGTVPYTYLWSSGGTSSTETGLSAGSYTVTITDGHGCTSTSTINITQPALLVASVPVSTNISCFGGSNGTATAIGTGGTQPYLFSWSNGTFTAYQGNLIVGNYSVTITDSHGCTSSASITLTQPTALAMTINSTDVTCFGDHNGSATANVSGGVNPYSYFWTPVGLYTSTVTQLAAGTYTATIVDTNGCTISQSVTINQPPSLLVGVSNIVDVSCHGGNDGAGTVNASGGTAPYTYLWSGSGQTTPTVTNLSTGVYTVLITDNNGCTTSVNVPIGEPTPVLLTTTGDATVCKGNSVTISAAASGGTPPYTYFWDNGLGAGQSFMVQVWGTITYSVTVTDANGCTTSPGIITLNAFPGLSLVIGGPTDVCEGETTTITAVAGGGNGGPYVYTWNNGIGVATPPIQVQPEVTTTYIVGVADGCGSPMAFDTITVVVHEKPVPNFTVDKLYDCEAFTVHFTDHTFPPLTSYEWDFGDPYSGTDNQSTSPSPSHFFSNTGHYTITLTVTNEWGCSATFTYDDLIFVYSKPIADFSWSPDPVSIEEPLVQFNNESVDALTYDWSFGDAATGPMNFSDLENPIHEFSAVGSYMVWLSVANKYGCVDSVSKEIIILDLYTFYAPNAFTPNGDGVNDYFIPQSTNLDYSTFEFYVYDRWGELVYDTNDPNAPWDGRAKSSKKIVQQDVYTWFIYVSEISGRKHQFIGHVTVIK